MMKEEYKMSSDWICLPDGRYENELDAFVHGSDRDRAFLARERQFAELQRCENRLRREGWTEEEISVHIAEIMNDKANN